MQSKALVEAMRIAAEKSYPNEGCGLIVNIGKSAILVTCENISPEPTSQFVINPDDYEKAEELGEITAIWHSHVNIPPTPSDEDRAGCEASELPWLISSVFLNDEEFTVSEPYLLQPDGFAMEYLGRPYVYGVFDCYSLVTDFYNRELGVNMTRFQNKRIDRFWEKGLDFFTDCADSGGSENFIEILDDSYIENDILIFNINSKVPNHIAIYIGNDIILHHAHNRLSRRETYGVFWSKFKTRQFRHKSKC